MSDHWRHLITYVGDCPSCGRAIRESFVRGSVSKYRHVTSVDHRDCHLVVAAHPTSDDHVVRPVLPEESFEEAQQRVMEEVGYAEWAHEASRTAWMCQVDAEAS